MNSGNTARTLMADQSVASDNGFSASNRPTDSHDFWQSGKSFRVELLMMVPQLRAFTRMLSSDKSSAEFLAHQTLAKAWRDRGACRPGTNLKAWLFTIARNEFYTSRGHGPGRAPFDQAAGEELPTHSADQILSADRSDTMRALQLLPDEFRDALILVGASGCSYEEAARICGCPVGTTKSRVFRARRALGTILDGSAFEQRVAPA